jgi:hypothetical protein
MYFWQSILKTLKLLKIRTIQPCFVTIDWIDMLFLCCSFTQWPKFHNSAQILWVFLAWYVVYGLKSYFIFLFCQPFVDFERLAYKQVPHSRGSRTWLGLTWPRLHMYVTHIHMAWAHMSHIFRSQIKFILLLFSF